MSEIRVITENGKTYLDAPYHPDLPAKGRALGGKFDARSKCWVFDARDEGRVRELALEVYGDDGSPQELVTLRCRADNDTFGLNVRGRQTSVYVAGRQVARVYGRDSGARLGNGVVVVSGGFRSGGSAKNPTVDWDDDTLFELRDVPRSAAERAVTQAPEHVEITASSGVDYEALKAERQRLVARIAEIDELLSPGETTSGDVAETGGSFAF